MNNLLQQTKINRLTLLHQHKIKRQYPKISHPQQKSQKAVTAQLNNNNKIFQLIMVKINKKIKT
jgi:hypothetical protein